MRESRVETLIAKLEKGAQKTQQILSSLTVKEWQTVIYTHPHSWTVRDLLAHFVSAEEALLRMAQDVASGGPGSPQGFDLDGFNAAEQKRLADRSPQYLLAALTSTRRDTMEWVRTLTKEALDRVGQHPALGEISVETMVLAIYGHQLMHMRDLQGVLKPQSRS